MQVRKTGIRRRGFFTRHPVLAGVVGGLLTNGLQDLVHSRRVRKFAIGAVRRLPKLRALR